MGIAMHETNFNPKNLYRIGGISALVQLAAISSSIVSSSMVTWHGNVPVGRQNL